MKNFILIGLVATLQLKAHVPRIIKVRLTEKGPVISANTSAYEVSRKAGKITVISN